MLKYKVWSSGNDSLILRFYIYMIVYLNVELYFGSSTIAYFGGTYLYLDGVLDICHLA